MDTFIRANGKVIGHYVFLGVTTLIKDANLNTLGRYDSQMDKTYKQNGEVLGIGNLLTMLLR
jgi:hypothetical protein